MSKLSLIQRLHVVGGGAADDSGDRLTAELGVGDVDEDVEDDTRADALARKYRSEKMLAMCLQLIDLIFACQARQ